jgi:histidine triad (HIT) family protein
MSYDSNNIFAKILRGEASAHKVYEDDHTLAFMDITPQSTGHTLIIPKVEAENIYDIDEANLAHLIATTKRVAHAVRDALKPDGIMVGQFNGAPAGQTVFHLHFHVIPRYAGQPLKGHGKAEMADQDELAAVAKRIKGAL